MKINRKKWEALELRMSVLSDRVDQLSPPTAEKVDPYAELKEALERDKFLWF